MRRLTSVVGLIENSVPILDDDRLDTHKFLNSMMLVALNHKLCVLKNHAIVHYSDPMWSTQNLKEPIFRKSRNSRHCISAGDLINLGCPGYPNQWSENWEAQESSEQVVYNYGLCNVRVPLWEQFGYYSSDFSGNRNFPGLFFGRLQTEVTILVTETHRRLRFLYAFFVTS